jgi:hypothetical protein
MTAALKPTLTVTWSTGPDGAPVVTAAATSGASPDPVTFLMDPHRSDVEVFMALAGALGAEVVEVGTPFQSSAEQEREDFDRKLARDKARRERFLAHCRRATAADYKAWLDGWVAGGGAPSHSYDYDLPGNWWVLESPADLPPMCGALSVKVIVPEGVGIFVERGVTHNAVFFMGGGVAGDQDSVWVPTYRNVRVAG